MKSFKSFITEEEYPKEGKNGKKVSVGKNTVKINPNSDELKEAEVQPPAERLKTDRNMYSIPQKERDAAKARLLAKTKEIRNKKKIREEIEIEEGMTMKDFKANRKKNERRAASADAEKRGHVGKQWYNSGNKYSPDEAKRSRANLSDYDRQKRYQTSEDPDSDNAEDYPASKTKNPKKLRKQKAMGEALSFSDFMEARRMDKEGVDRGDTRRTERADKAKASLAKAQKQKKSFQSHHDKETAAGRTPRLSRDTPTIPEREHKKNFPGSRQEPKERGAKETPLQTHNRRVNRSNARVVKHGFTKKEKEASRGIYSSRFD